MSHNTKYYSKKIRKRDAIGSKTLTLLWSSTELKECPETESAQENDETNISQCYSKSSEESTRDVDTGSSVTSGDTCVSPPSESVHSNVEPLTQSNSSPSKNACASEIPLKKTPDRRLFDSLKYESSYPWLYYNVAKAAYMCKYCELFPSITEKGISKWGEQGVVFKDHISRQLEKHVKSEHHNKAENKYKTAQSAYVQQSVKKSGRTSTTIYQQIKKQASNNSKDEKSKNREVLKKMFRTIYFICRQQWAQRSYGELIKFIAAMGVHDLQEHIETAPAYATYLSDKTASELIDIIGNHLENKLLMSAREASFFTLLADESTDEQNREQMVIFIKWPSESDNRSHFAGIINVEKTDAESLMNAIQMFCVGKGLDLAKCRFVGFDGANVMSGEVSGIV